MSGDGRPVEGHRRGFVFGELLIAFLLLAVAVSSLAALMYSVSRRPVASADAGCVASAAATGKCVPVKPVSATAPSKLLRSADPGRSYQLTGKVVQGSIVRNGAAMRFAVRDRNGKSAALPVTYTGEVPDPFRGGREIIVKGTMRGGTFVGERDSLVTKCPSKFQAAPNSSKT